MPSNALLRLDLSEDGASHAETTTTTATKAASPSYSSSAVDHYMPLHWSARIAYGGHRCTLRYSKSTDRVSIVRLTRQGRERVLLNIPTFVILNVESSAEAAARQDGRKVSDEIVRKAFQSSGSSASLLCIEPSLSFDQQLIYAHSRSNTGFSLDGVRSLQSQPRSQQETPRRAHYVMHYVRIRDKEVPTIHSIELNSITGLAEAAAELHAIVLALLRRVYMKGAKSLSVFISPTSGKGEGVPIYATQVYPLLHFSRHDITTFITDHAHECEDYIADLTNRLDCRDVVVSAGGDGMIHEVVNGLHRRRLAVVRRWRREQAQHLAALAAHNYHHDGDGGDEDEHNTNGRANAHAKDKPHNNDDDNNNDDHHEVVSPMAASNAARPPLAQLGRPSATLSNAATTTNTTVSLPSTAALHTPVDALTPERHLSEPPAAHQTPQPLQQTSEAHRAEGHDGRQQVVEVTSTIDVAGPFAGGRRRDSDPLNHDCGSAAVNHNSPLGNNNDNNNNASMNSSTGMCSYLYSTPFSDHAPTLEDGWGALLPLVATIATGSACGLAKSMDVLSITSSALALVHLHSCHVDLLRLRFRPNPELVAAHRSELLDKASASSRRKLEASFAEYQNKYGRELRARRQASREDSSSTTTANHSDGSNASSVLSPFLQDGTPVFDNAVALHLGAPRFAERVAFMSLSFGVANDIDRGSEALRWMGNARFSVYGGYVLLKGVQTYRGVMRYLPWTSKTGVTLEKLHKKDKMPRSNELPMCTMREYCPHCEQHAAASSTSLYPPSGTSTPLLARLGAASQTQPSQDYLIASQTQPRLEASTSLHTTSELLSVRPADLTACTDNELLGEDEVDFEDATLPWVTIRGAFYNLLLCNIRDTAQDMIMAPVSHLSDGAIDVVFSVEDKTARAGGRREFLQFFTGLEKGKHVNYDFTSYVKARAVEVKIDEGIVMADGEMMPLDAVRVTKLRDGVRFVRSE